MKAGENIEKTFRTLGRDVEQRWRRKGHRRSAFPEVASQCLRDHALHERLAAQQIIRWALSARRVIQRHAALEPMWWGLHAALIGAMVGGVFDHYFFNLDFHHSVVFFWLFVSLAASATRLALHTENLRPERTR